MAGGGATACARRLLVRPASPFRFRTYSTQPPRGSNNTVKFWPFLAIIGLGTAGYVMLVRAKAASRNTPVRRLQ
ncbi:hypothetical protein F5Y00DRAFT_229994 [Daldinia vernicosa]|uniref:uncharacterized protein n=1 Tax=Daldinia vernicosa TaxID=114800 RepID=UPI002008BE69|nr:uncharacterized protein F5Y00DRAFT_229994 [Daldinia vernicosa]KAI0851524.1 hypothetical protein F5Y00DRAFT_229994 [Daldinia vernicosa]